MQLSALSLAITRLGRVPAYSPLALFTGTTTGAWYDPSDINLTWRRNLLTYSEQFDNAVWSKVSSAVSVNQITAPDGATTADFMVETATTAEHLILQSQALSWGAGSKVVGSVYAKSGGRRYIRLLIGGSNAGWNAYCVFDLIAASTGAPAANSAAIVSRSITDVGNGWYRCELVATPTVSSSSGAVIQFNTMLSMDANASNYTGDGTSGIYIWGAQLELGSTATPYQRITDGIQDYLQYQAQPVLYRDAAGTQPVTAVEQPVGLMLDKSKGLVLGPELVTNGGFDSASDWVLGSGWSISGGVASANPATGIINQNAYYTRYQTGKTYLITITISSYTSGYLQCYLRGNLGSTATNVFNSARTWTCIATAGSSTTEGIVFGFGNFVGSVDNISVRELPGNHAFNSSGTSANFPVLSARYNLLTKTENFSDNAVWLKDTGVSVDSTKYAAPDGTLTADRITFSGANLLIRQAVTAASGPQYKSYLWIKGTANQTIQIATTGTDELVTFNGDWQLYTGTKNFVNANFIINTYGGSTARDILVWHPDLRVANDALNQPAYQRVNTSTDYDTVGFKPYLRFNGTNQWLQTNSIDFSYGDKMFVSAGVRKLSDVSVGVVTELSVSAGGGTSGTFVLHGQTSPVGYRYAAGSGASGAAFATDDASVFTAPITNVVSGISDFAGVTIADEISVRVNGAAPTQTRAGTVSTGNFGNYPLYIGARGGSSLWFNGRLYQMVIAGKQASAAEINSTETYLNQKTGAY